MPLPRSADSHTVSPSLRAAMPLKSILFTTVSSGTPGPLVLAHPSQHIAVRAGRGCIDEVQHRVGASDLLQRARDADRLDLVALCRANPRYR